MLSIIKSKDCIRNYLNKKHMAFDLVSLYEISKEHLKRLSEENSFGESFVKEQLKRNLKHLTDFSVTQIKRKTVRRHIPSPLANEKSGFLQ